MHDLLGADDFAAERFADGLVAQAHAQIGLPAKCLSTSTEMPACRRFRAGEMQMWSGFSASISSIVISSLR
jgi:hypothetical protein